MNKSVIALMLLFFFVSCKKENKDLLFKKIPADKTKVDFINEVIDTKELNILDYLYFNFGKRKICMKKKKRKY